MADMNESTTRHRATLHDLTEKLRAKEHEDQDIATAIDPEGHHLTDLGNAKRLVARHGRDMRYCGTQKQWLVWNGRVWAWDTTGQVERHAKETVTNLYREAVDLDPKDRKDLIQHAKHSEALTRIRAMMALAESEPSIPISMEDLDANTSILPCRNGTIDLVTGDLREHRREDFTTRHIDIPHDPLNECPRWTAFLEEMVPDADTRVWIQHFFGYAAAGSASEHVVPIAFGAGGNGKSTIVDVISGVLGPYVVHADIETFLLSHQTSSGGAATPDLARLKGARLVMASESGAGRKLNVARVKDLAGGEPIVARELYGKPFQFTPHFSIWLSTNDKPVVPGNDFALWRRLRLIPFLVQVPEARRILHFDQLILAEEASGVLNWMLDGLSAWRASGRLPQASAIELATEEYRIENDPIGQWIDDGCDVEPGLSDTASGLYGAYTSWFEGQEPTHKPMSQTAFGRELEKKGYTKEKIGGGIIIRHGLRLRQSGL